MEDDAPRQSIYISYASESEDDAEFVHRLFAALEEHGKLVTSFSSRAGLVELTYREKLRGAKEEWREAAQLAIKAADVVLFVLSPDALKSEFCEMEMWYARRLDKIIIAVQTSLILDGLFPEWLGEIKRIYFVSQIEFDTSLRVLLEVLERAPRGELPKGSAEETERVAAAERATTPEGIVAGASALKGFIEAAESATGSETVVTVSLDYDGVAGSLRATPALANLLARTLIVREHANDFRFDTEEPFDISFSWLLLALLISDDLLSAWFRRYADEVGLNLELLYVRTKVNEDALRRAADAPITIKELDAVKRVTVSANDLLNLAHSIANEVSGKTSPPGVRHLMAAYIYHPAGHKNDLAELGLSRPDWSNSFLGWIKQNYPEELAAWKKIHRERFPDNPPFVIDEGPSTHIATDRWTTEDSLGYGAYAHAICRFMTHRQTRAPLTISIQAPWGGGKTSLMRMIQKELDPQAVADVDDEAAQPRGELTIKQVLGEVQKWIDSNTQEKLPQVKDNASQVLTVWFNAWKYESVNQVWAGLVDAIMRQVAARLGVLEREQFWLRLNLKRIDADRLRQRIHDRVFRTWWRTMRKVALAAGALLFASLIVMIGGWQSEVVRYLGVGGTTLSFAVGTLVGWAKFLRTKKSVEKEPAAVSLGEYLDIPDYNAELGFIHRVEADLRRVLASVPRRRRADDAGDGNEKEQNLRIVVFIDDLDRCSPTKVAQVIEAVNLFLAGDFKDCMFVLGMDTEMVAAALQAAHKEMIACLPADAGIPVGWRFMDKFVQLPFLIPPTEETGLEQYTTSLLSANKRLAPDARTDELATKAAPRVTTRIEADREVKRLREANEIDEAGAARLMSKLEAQVAQVVRRRVDEGIEKFSDENEEIRRVVSKATTYFRGNPRELKRFVNAFRFNYFLWWAHRAQGFRSPTLDQLLRWTVLSLRWPEVVRWLRRSGGNEWRADDGQSRNGDSANGDEQNGDAANVENATALPTRLKLLEEISGGAGDLAAWQASAGVSLRLKTDSTAWLNDDDLLQFFNEEFKNYPVGERLSDGAGKGLW
jgi:hypothetical protein